MNWITTPVIFSSEHVGATDAGARLKPDFLLLLQEFCSVDTSQETQFLDGIPVVQSYTEANPVVSVIAGDNEPLTRFQTACLSDGSQTLEPVEEGYAILYVSWPQHFIEAISSPESKPEWLKGVRIP